MLVANFFQVYYLKVQKEVNAYSDLNKFQSEAITGLAPAGVGPREMKSHGPPLYLACVSHQNQVTSDSEFPGSTIVF